MAWGVELADSGPSRRDRQRRNLSEGVSHGFRPSERDRTHDAGPGPVCPAHRAGSREISESDASACFTFTDPGGASSASSDLGSAGGTRVPVAVSVPAAIPAITAPTTAETLPIRPLSDREWAFLYLLRDVDQVISLGTLSPFERAAMAGAKVVFDHLSAECERMLARKVSDLVGPLPELVEEPVSAAPETVAAPSDRPKDTPGAGSVPSSGAVPDGAGGSLTERLARLESRLEQLVQIIGQQSR